MDPSEFNNKNKINRIATPIKIDSNGQPITAMGQSVEIVEDKSKISRDNHISLNTVLVLVLLLILTIIVLLICHFILPDLLVNKNNKYQNDRTTTIPITEVTTDIIPYTLTEASTIDYVSQFQIEEAYTIALKNSGSSFELVINNNVISNVTSIKSEVALIGEFLCIRVNEKGSRSSIIYLIDIDGNVVTKLDKLTDDGMLINDDANISFLSDSIVVPATRVIGSSLVLDSKLGNINGINICDREALENNNIGDKYLVMANYSVKYISKGKFGEPTFINGVSLKEYKTENKTCN